MYLSQMTARNFRQFGEGESQLNISFNRGVTALIGRNDSGKSTVIDAIRYVLLTRDQNYIRVQPEDFHITKDGRQASEILIQCTFHELDKSEKGAFIEYLSYDQGTVSLVVNWAAKRLKESPAARRWIDVSLRSGLDGTGPIVESSVRELLASTYLKPLRDAEREMSSGRGSRLSQVLTNFPGIKEGEPFNSNQLPANDEEIKKLSLLGLTDYTGYRIEGHQGVHGAQKSINDDYLSKLSLTGDGLKGKIGINEGGTDDTRLRQLLERLELVLRDGGSDRTRGHFGLGSNNLLYMACELLLLGGESDGLPLLLIEEPEAHLHPQRQLRLVEFLSEAAKPSSTASQRPVQVILSTHSPNLASKINLPNLVLLEDRHAYSLAEDQTHLDKSDYRFLQRFLDVTKANLFFAHGVIIVEGDAEAILLPTLAKLMDVDLTEHGISVVNVGGTGLRRYSRIFQRQNQKDPPVSIPVACITDMDVMPDCAPDILGLVKGDDDENWTNTNRRWHALRDFGIDESTQAQGLAGRRTKLQNNDGQSVKTFVADHWTLEYDLAYNGLAQEVHLSAYLAKNDDPFNEGGKVRDEVKNKADKEFAQLIENYKVNEVLCSHVYKVFYKGNASKAVAAQHLAELLMKTSAEPEFDKAAFSIKIPDYIKQAIEYVKTSLVQQHIKDTSGDKDDA